MRIDLYRCILVLLAGPTIAAAQAPSLKQEPNTWVKRSPLPGGPISPGMGYEASFGYDPVARRVIRWAGHNQGGGGEQNAETWTYDVATSKWELKEPNLAPPGVCCAQQNVFDPVHGRFLRFKAFSGSHGWQWYREIYLNNSAVWSYDLARNTWRDLRTVPAPTLAPLRCASWDSDNQVVVIFGGEGSQEGTIVFDPHDNSWTRMQPKVQPAPRSGGNMAYDPVHHRHILFGSQFGNDPHTWAYDLAKNEWTDLKPAMQPPTNENDPVLAYDEASGVIVAHVRETAGKDMELKSRFDTWIYDGAANTWKKMNPPGEPPGASNRRRIMVAVPDQNVILMENYVNPPQRVPGVDREQQIWTYRYAEPKPAPQPVRGVRVSTVREGALVEWQPAAGAARYVIFRGIATRPWLAKFEPLEEMGPRDTSLRDGTLHLQPGEIAWYYVCARGADKQLGPPSQRARFQPPVVQDVVVSVKSPREVVIQWSRPSPDVLAYHVERAPVDVFSEDEIVRLRKDTPPLDEPSVGGIRAIGRFERITKVPLQKTAFTDRDVDLSRPATIDGKPLFTHRFGKDQVNVEGKPYRYGVYAYRVVAEYSPSGVAGGGGPYALTIPSSPQWLFSREAGQTCHLKWVANPESDLRGYRVYRMESPRINGAGQKTNRLTPEPLASPGYVDETAGNVTRRFWVVAVDALGQEGFPSAPTWFEREYKRFYLPFTSEWHQ